MGYAVELFLDPPEAEELRESMKIIESPIPVLGGSPHISLAVFDEVELPALVEVVRDFAARTRAFQVGMSSIGIFPSDSHIVFLAPVVTRQLLDLHEVFHSQLQNTGLLCHSLYRPGSWVPHCTVTFDVGSHQIIEAIDLLENAKCLKDYRVSSIHIVSFRPVIDIASFPLISINTEQGGGANPAKSGGSP